MPKVVGTERYKAYKEQVWELTNARQRWEPGGGRRGLSDAEIAETLGLEAWEVTEIRAIAENERIPLAAYRDAEDEKEARLRRLAKGRARGR